MTDSRPTMSVCRGRTRAQLPMPAIEGALAVILVLGVLGGFALGVTQPDAQQPQLEAYAADAVTILANEPPQHRSGTRLAEVAESRETFERERKPLNRRVDRILPDNLMYRVTTPHGTVGFANPGGVPTGRATVTTINGAVTVAVWYA